MGTALVEFCLLNYHKGFQNVNRVGNKCILNLLFRPLYYSDSRPRGNHSVSPPRIRGPDFAWGRSFFRFKFVSMGSSCAVQDAGSNCLVLSREWGNGLLGLL